MNKPETITAQVGAAPLHPLEPLTCEEIATATALVREAAGGDGLRFEIVELKEPSKAAVRGFSSGAAAPREARVNVYRLGTIGVWRYAVLLSEARIVSEEHRAEAAPMIQLEEFLEIEGIVKADPAFREACRTRGIEDVNLVCVDPWSAGSFDVPGEEGRHLSHAFCWVKSSPTTTSTPTRSRG